MFITFFLKCRITCIYIFDTKTKAKRNSVQITDCRRGFVLHQLVRVTLLVKAQDTTSEDEMEKASLIEGGSYKKYSFIFLTSLSSLMAYLYKTGIYHVLINIHEQFLCDIFSALTVPTSRGPIHFSSNTFKPEIHELSDRRLGCET